MILMFSATRYAWSRLVKRVERKLMVSSSANYILVFLGYDKRCFHASSPQADFAVSKNVYNNKILVACLILVKSEL